MPADVHFLIGRAGSGKSHIIKESIKENMRLGQRAILIVPEQFTYETESALSRELGGLIGIQVLSFARLAERTGAAQELPFLSRQGRRMVLRRVTYQQKGALTAFAGVAHRASFAAGMDNLLTLCKRFLITPDMLRDSAAKLNARPALAAKLTDIALLYGAVEEYMQSHFIDGEDALNALIKSLPSSFFAGAIVYIDGFDALSAQVYAILDGLMQHCGSLTFSICMDPSAAAKDAALFAPERMCYERLLARAGELNCRVFSRECAYAPPEKDTALVFMERNLHAYPFAPFAERTKAVSIMGAVDRAAEVEAVADEILRLAQRGVRFRDMAVVASDLAAYSTLMRRACLRRGIPLFFDAGRGMNGHPVVELLMNAARVASGGLYRAHLLRIAKTNLAGVTQDEAEALENYCLRRGILGGQAFENPFAAEEPEAERARAALVPPLLALQKAFAAETAAEKTQALFDYLVALGVQRQLAALVRELNEAGRFALVQEHAQVWDILLELFGQLYVILGSSKISRREYVDVLKEAVSAYQVGIIPATADQLLLGDMARTRSRGLEELFILGCNEGLLPAPRLDDDILDDEELDELAGTGLAPWSGAKARASEDQLDIYRAISVARRGLHISFAYSDGSREGVPSIFVDRVRELFPLVEEISAGVAQGGGIPAGESAGFSLLLRNLAKKDEPLFAALHAHFENAPQYAPRLRQAERLAGEPVAEASFGKAMARRLYGQKLYTTVSRLETFRECPFRHFAQYGLRAKTRPEFREKKADIGRFSHEALEAFVCEVPKRGYSFHTILDEQAEALLEELLQKCLEEYENGLLLATPRARVLSRFWKEAVRETALAICHSLREGSFAPLFTEVRFAPDGALPAVESADCVLSGVIDRIDGVRAEGGELLLRVVDYKTGEARLDYSKIADGVSLQLPLYLVAAGQGAGRPVGMFYQLVQSPDQKEGDESEIAGKLRLNGILLDEARSLFKSGDEEKGNAKPRITGSKLLTEEQLSTLLRFAVVRAGEIAKKLQSGYMAAEPTKMGRSSTCAYCEYPSVCRFESRLPGCRERSIPSIKADAFFARAAGSVKGGEA